MMPSNKNLCSVKLLRDMPISKDRAKPVDQSMAINFVVSTTKLFWLVSIGYRKERWNACWMMSS